MTDELQRYWEAMGWEFPMTEEPDPTYTTNYFDNSRFEILDL